MKTVHKCSLMVLILSMLYLSIAEKPVLAHQNGNDGETPLKNLVLTDDEISREWGIFPDMSLQQYDATSELSDICFVDCVKVVWVSSNNVVYNKLTLIMIRSRTSENANKSVQSLWQTYKSMGSRFYPYAEFTENANFWLGNVLYPGKTSSSIGKFQYIAARTQGQVSIMVYYDFIIRSFIAEFDGGTYLELVDDLSSAQQQKLLKAGFKP